MVIVQKGFSLTEVLVAVLITLIVATAVFQLFERNERLYRDQSLVTEMQQSARAAMSQISDEIRMAGQGVPRFAASFDSAVSEGTVAVLAGSSSARLNLRAGLAPAEANAIAPQPLTLTPGLSTTVTVDSAAGFYNAVGGSPSGRFVFVWGDSGNAQFVWVRAGLQSISQAARSLQVIPADSSLGGAVNFTVLPIVSLEEAISIYRDNSTATLKHTTATSMVNPASPVWAPANDLTTNVTQLRFDYFDNSGMPVVPDTLANREVIARIDVLLGVESAQSLGNHSTATYTLSTRTFIRGQTIR